MIYRFFKAVHGFTAFIGIIFLIMSASTSDYYTEIGQKEPESVGALIMWGAILMIPTVIYLILEYIKERYINVHNR